MNVKVMKTITEIFGILSVVSLFIVSTVFASKPEKAPRHHKTYSLEDIYNRLKTGADGELSAIDDPKYGPVEKDSSFAAYPYNYRRPHTLNEVMDAAPKYKLHPDKDAALPHIKFPETESWKIAGPEDVSHRKIFWGLGQHGDGKWADPKWGLTKGTARMKIQATGWENECFTKLNPLGNLDVKYRREPCIKNLEEHIGQDGNPYNTFDKGYKFETEENAVKREDSGFRFMLDWLPLPQYHPSRFFSNGTVIDQLTDLVWTRYVDCPTGGTGTGTGGYKRQLKWQEALLFANSLKAGMCGGLLQDDSKAGEWRLPTINELLTLVDFSGNDSTTDHVKYPENPDKLVLAQCHFKNELEYVWILETGHPYIYYRPQCHYAFTPDGTELLGLYPFENLDPGVALWSSTTSASDPNLAWQLNLRHGPHLLLQTDKNSYGSFIFVRKFDLETKRKLRAEWMKESYPYPADPPQPVNAERCPRVDCPQLPCPQPEE